MKDGKGVWIFGVWENMLAPALQSATNWGKFDGGGVEEDREKVGQI
jgi:hypothetical protein